MRTQTTDARLRSPWATSKKWCEREMRSDSLEVSQTLYACVKHAGAGITADAVRTVYQNRPDWFARIDDDEFHALMTGATDGSPEHSTEPGR